MEKYMHTKVAIIYDFDGTLAPGNMQEHSFLPDINMDKDSFWNKVDKITKQQKLDNILVYMDLMIREARKNSKFITKQNLTAHGKNLKLYQGVVDWFKHINAYAKNKNIEIEHYIISAGNKEILDGLAISHEFKKIYGCKFIFDNNDVAIGCGLAINYTNKTQFLFRINKDKLDETDKLVNKYQEEEKCPIPFRNMIFIGDGETDVPSFRLVKEKGGHSIAVYEPDKRSTKTKDFPKKVAQDLYNVGRVNFTCPTDYTKNKRLYQIVIKIIDKISADNAIKDLNLK